MNNLKNQVSSSSAQLDAVWQKLSSRSPSTVLPVECFKRWESAAAFHASLSDTIPLFEVREKAWQGVEALVDPKRIELEKLRLKDPQRRLIEGAKMYNFSHDGIEMDFPCARHLALASFSSVSWSIYDRLSNICGRMAATEEVRQHYKQNPKLIEDLLAREKDKSTVSDAENSEKKKSVSGRHDYGSQLFAFSMQYHLRAAYDWPSRVTYTIRNCLVHEGGLIGAVRLFHSDSIEDGLRLHSDAVQHIEKSCSLELDGNVDPLRCCLRGPANPWVKGREIDLIEVLGAYHGEVDIMFSGLLKWCVDSFVGQFAAFSARDKIVLSAGTAVLNP
jgi:hypothetical protein